jgi:hypothetical protein
MTHDIARHFSEAARRAAARCAYYPDPDDEYGPPRNVYGQCPIGVMVEVDLPGALPAGYWSPPAVFVQEAFQKHRKNWVHGPALSFMHDFDNNAITDLYEELGVERRES